MGGYINHKPNVAFSERGVKKSYAHYQRHKCSHVVSGSTSDYINYVLTLLPDVNSKMVW